MHLADRTLTVRNLTREEVTRLWEIDRGEQIENIYYLEDGELVLKPEHYDVQGWPPGEPELYTPILLECFDRGAWMYGVFDGDALVAMVTLDTVFIGPRHDLLQLKQLHVGRAHRGFGLGRRLFEMAREKARSLGAKGLYISATPSEHTINFYLRLGSTVTPVPDPELFALEPEDIHLECPV
ncbi:MAG: GNAT family N-acetyltransferase [Anaerolineae bacterium]